jgi:hypothetical protein
MARSKYIYIAYDTRDTLLVAGTVKWEVLAYLKRYFPATEVAIRRYGDGDGSRYNVLSEDHRK